MNELTKFSNRMQPIRTQFYWNPSTRAFISLGADIIFLLWAEITLNLTVAFILHNFVKIYQDFLCCKVYDCPRIEPNVLDSVRADGQNLLIFFS